MEVNEYNSQEFGRENIAMDIDCNFTDVPLQGLHSKGLTLGARPKIQLSCINRQKSMRSLLRKKSPSEIVKNNILKSRYSKRKQQLKELTHNNVQMFLRIKAQQSHYSLKNLKPHKQREESAQLSRAKDTIPDDDRSNKQNIVRFRCKSAKLINRCSELKQNILKDRREDASTGFTVYTDRDHNDRDNVKSRVSRREVLNDKENQGNNCEKLRAIKNIQLSKELQRKMIAKKLCFNPKRESQPLKARALENQRLLLKKEEQIEGYLRFDRSLRCTESKRGSS